MENQDLENQAGPRRVIIENVAPEIDGGSYYIKRTPGEKVTVEADIFADGHDILTAIVKHREGGAKEWTETLMKALSNDRWKASFPVTRLGSCFYTIEAWVDRFKSWRRDFEKKAEAEQDLSMEFLIGASLLRETAKRIATDHPSDAEHLRKRADELSRKGAGSAAEKIERALHPVLTAIVSRHPDRRWATVYPKELEVFVEPELARFGAWYELFPRSCSTEPGRHGTFKDCERLLPRVAKMGFDVLYFPPVHPIGRTFRKGKNNNPVAESGEPGSPWGIGAEEGGHKSVHPELGTLDDFTNLVWRARTEFKIEIALDIAFQCAHDHPYVQEHPGWFVQRPDGSIQYAENPPKKYQDIYPLNFESSDWVGLWKELKSIFDFWIEQGVQVFRVDNPHTKALPFWEWVIREIKSKRPEIIFLSEAFTRRKVMYSLAKAGFSQSYNYFPWRNNRFELTEYFTELTQTEVSEYFRPALWPNTPDILPQYLQYGGRPAFMIRLLLAGTLGATYGIYGPAFELCENQAREVGSEEYLNSEKYEIREWNLDGAESMTDLIGRFNRIRRENPSLHSNESLFFHAVDNEQILVYSKQTENLENILLMVVNLDPYHTQTGWITLNLEQLGIKAEESFQVHDLLTGSRYLWQGRHNYVQLDPHFVPAHLFRIRRWIRTERDFDYFM
ncbi:MAG: maltotransferase domain-containing protein [Opitutales bacterium]